MLDENHLQKKQIQLIDTRYFFILRSVPLMRFRIQTRKKEPQTVPHKCQLLSVHLLVYQQRLLASCDVAVARSSAVPPLVSVSSPQVFFLFPTTLI